MTEKSIEQGGSEPKIRVQFEDFQPKHFDIAPIWEFAIDEECEDNQDETTLRPAYHLTIADPSEGLLVVKTQFQTADGKKYHGLCSPAFEYNFGDIQPYLYTENGVLSFWMGIMQPDIEYIDKLYRQFNFTADSLFPIIFKALTPYKGAPLEGQIDGFMYSVGHEVITIK